MNGSRFEISKISILGLGTGRARCQYAVGDQGTDLGRELGGGVVGEDKDALEIVEVALGKVLLVALEREGVVNPQVLLISPGGEPRRVPIPPRNEHVRVCSGRVERIKGIPRNPG